MIPVLGIPILVGPELLWKTLDAFGNHEIGEIIVIDNGGVVNEEETFRRGVTVVNPGANLGVAGSWNHIIRIRPKARWWAIFNFDIEVGEGDLQRLDDHMATVGGLALLSSFSAFGVDRATVSRVGLFDENFAPAYYEDNDYYHRCELAGVCLTGLASSAVHHNSSTLELSPEAKNANRNTFESNKLYYKAKWGGLPYRETFTTPFDAGGPLSEWHFDLERHANHQWF